MCVCELDFHKYVYTTSKNQWVGVQPLFAITNHVQNVAKTWVSLPGQLGFTHDVTATTAFQIWKISSPRNQRLSKVTLNPLIHWWNHPRSLSPPIQQSMHTAVLRTPTHAVLLADLQEFEDSNAGGVATCTTTPETKPPSCVNLNSTIEKHNQEFHIGRKWRTLWIEEILSSSWRLSCGAMVKNSLTLLKYLKLLPERQGPDPGSSCRKLVSEHPIPVCSLKSS